MSIAEILEIERNREESSTWNVIHLFKEGSFYRAYEWSAWLITVVPFNDSVRNGTQDRKPLTVTRKKDIEKDRTGNEKLGLFVHKARSKNSKQLSWNLATCRNV